MKRTIYTLLTLVLTGMTAAWAGDAPPTAESNKTAIDLVQSHADYVWTLVAAALAFDLVLLGMGEDGHTASLFPGQAHAPGELVHAVLGAPKPPPQRVSLGLAALNEAHEVLVLIAGSSKHGAVERWRRGEDLPVTRIHGHNGVDVYLDNDANETEQDQARSPDEEF